MKLGSCSLGLNAPFTERGTYKNDKSALLALIGYSVGYGNFWRLPYLCSKFGGVTFLIPYTISMLCFGIPLYFMELTLGTYTSVAPTRLFSYMCPILSGTGYGMVFILFVIAIYYNIVIAWTLFYICQSFAFSDPAPWARCDYANMSEDCSQDTMEGRVIAAKYYYEHRILALPINEEEGHSPDYKVNLNMVGSLGIAWILIVLFLARGIRGTSRILYFTVIYPYVMMAVILAYSWDTKKNMLQSTESFFTVNTTLFTSHEMWTSAATHVIYSLGVAYGGIIALASYNKLHHNILRDTFLVFLIEGLTSLISAYFVYSLSGILMEEPGIPSPNLFITLPAVLSEMGLLGLWTLLFFVMIFTLGFDSQLMMVETVTTSLFDEFHLLRRKYILVLGGVCFIMFLFGVPMTMGSGKGIYDLLDASTSSHSLLLLGLLEVITVSYIYGFDNMLKILKERIGIWVPKPFQIYWAITWKFLTPVSLLLLLISSLCSQDWSGDRFSSAPLYIMSLLISFSAFLIVPLRAVYVLFLGLFTDGFTWQTFQFLWQAKTEFCPEYERNNRGMRPQHDVIEMEPVSLPYM